MGIVMFFIFLITDLIVVISCSVVCGKNNQYREGMVFGVHIPKHAMAEEKVLKLCHSFGKQWRIMTWINVLLSSVVCVLCFWDFEIFTLVWIIWLTVYLALVYYMVLKPHRVMYRLKLENNWINDKTKHRILIDTRLSKEAGKMAPGWRWHIPAVIITIGAGTVLLLSPEWRDSKVVSCSLGISIVAAGVMFLLLHRWIVDKRNMTYSESTEVNLKVNQAVKRSWGMGLLIAGWLNAISAAYLTTQLIKDSWVFDTTFLIYGLIQGAACILPLGLVFWGQHTKRTILEQDDSVIYTDDDEYWRNGWYSNPGDSHLLVASRMSDTNYTFNMARPTARVICGGLAAVTIGTLVWIGSLMLNIRNAEVIFTMEGTKAEFEAAGYSSEFDVSQIQEVELLNQLPDERFVKTNGASTNKFSIGHYRGRETGKCMMFLYRDSTPVLKIIADDELIYANSDNPKVTEEWYEMLAEQK